MSRDWSYVGELARLRKAAQQALEVLDVLILTTKTKKTAFGERADALRAALAKPARKPACIFPQCVSTTRTQCEAWASGACEERI